MAFQALIFDLGGVIIPHDNDVLYRTIAARCTAPDAFGRIKADDLDHRYGAGEIGIPDLHRRCVEEHGYDGDWDQFREDFCVYLGLDEAMLDLAERLAATNRVALFSNTNAVHWAHVLNLTDGRLAAFEAYLSHEIGNVKPRIEAFELVARLAEVEPGRCLFVDDRLDNVEGARRAGFQAHHFTGQARLEALLREAEVTWPERAKMERTG